MDLASNMSRAGDVILMTKGVAIATALLSRVFPKTIQKTFGVQFLERAQKYLYKFSVVEDALTAASVGRRDNGVTAMHDVTEGGLFGALYEFSQASNVGLEIELSEVFASAEALQNL
jgi:hydrogenase maturation factor